MNFTLKVFRVFVHIISNFAIRFSSQVRILAGGGWPTIFHLDHSATFGKVIMWAFIFIEYRDLLLRTDQ